MKLNERTLDFERIDEAAHYIPSGKNVWDGRQERFDLTELKCYRALREARRLERSLGTLDEAPMAYKSLADIIDVIADAVDVIEVLKPVYNFKAD